MGVYDAIRASNGVTSYLNRISDKIDIGKPKKKTYRAQDEHLNNILRQFGKDYNIQMLKNNSPNYKGSFNPFMANCEKVQDNWELFKEWLMSKYGIDKN